MAPAKSRFAGWQKRHSQFKSRPREFVSYAFLINNLRELRGKTLGHYWFFFSLFLCSGELLGPQRCGAAHFLTRYDGLGSLRRQVSDSHQVVDCCGECEHPAHSLPPPVPRLPHQPDGLQPPEHFLDSFAFSQI